ncbi:hypothetical protein [Comamonas sp. F1-6]|uniref:hypothetical protein n=1 Tax=Comamonas sp. F1-6 TaxID=673550 RepID=UPI0031D79D56
MQARQSPLHLLHPEKYLQNSLKFLRDGSDNSFNRETKPCHQRATAAKHKELQAGVLDWAAAAAHPEYFRSLWRRRFDRIKEFASWQ